MANEGVVFNGLDLNGSGLTLEAFDAGMPEKRPEWVKNADTDGALLLRDPFFENAEMSMRIRVDRTASFDLAAQRLQDIAQMIEECERTDGGLPLVWTPADGTSASSLTFYVLSGQVDPLPITQVGDDAGWFLKTPIVNIKLTRKPFGYGPWLDRTSDDFSSNTIGNYTFDTGGGTLSVSGGQLVPSSTAEKRLYHSSTPYSVPDAWTTLKVTTGASVASAWSTAAIGKRIDANNYIAGKLNRDGGGTNQVQVVKVVAGVETVLAGTATTLSASTSYWIRFRVEGNVLTAEKWNSAPTATGAATSSATYTLAGAEITQFGRGVKGRQGMRLIPVATDYRWDDFLIEPYSTQSSLPLATLEVSGVPGDVSALGRLVVTEAAGQARRHFEWGMETNGYTPSSPSSLLIDSDSMTVSGYAGVQTAGSGYDPNAAGTNVVRATCTGSIQAICSTGTQTHVGSFRVKVRIASVGSMANLRIRLAWSIGSAQPQYTPWAFGLPTAQTNFAELDLGVITIPTVTLGSQSWTGEIQAYSLATPDTLDVDYIELIPVDTGYGKASSSLSVGGALVAYDLFTSTAAAGNLNTRVPPLGAAWATEGSATDFQFVDGTPFSASDEGVTRSAAGDRRGAIGSNQTSMNTTALFATQAISAGAQVQAGILARYVDANNYIVAYVDVKNNYPSPATATLNLAKKVAGTTTVLVSQAFTASSLGTLQYSDGWLSLSVLASGLAQVSFGDNPPSWDISLAFSDTAFATGGALQTGKTGIYESTVSGTVLTYFTTVYGFTFPAEGLVLAGGKQMEVRYDDTLSESSAGGTWGQPTEYRGSRLLLPPEGANIRSNRIAFKARRNNIDDLQDDNVTDALAARVAFQPRYLVPPGA